MLSRRLLLPRNLDQRHEAAWQRRAVYGWGDLRLQNRADALQALGDNLSDYKPFNPLDKKNLGISVGDALLNSEASSLPPGEKFIGAGTYCLYYRGSFEPYHQMAESNSKEWRVPIYVGKAVPAGALAM